MTTITNTTTNTATKKTVMIMGTIMGAIMTKNMARMTKIIPIIRRNPITIPTNRGEDM